MLAEACFVWNHALELQKRHYRIYGTYIDAYKMQMHFNKRIKRRYLHCHTLQEILQRLDKSYIKFFNKESSRPPKPKKQNSSISIVFKRDKRKSYVGGCTVENNEFRINKLKKKFKFFKSRDVGGNIKRIILKRDRQSEYYIFIVTEKDVQKREKSHNGASVGIDFGLKTYLSFSDGNKDTNPLFVKKESHKLNKLKRSVDKSKKGSGNYERKRICLARAWKKVCNKRNDYQWKLAHELCSKYDFIFIEDLDNKGILSHREVNRKIKDISHFSFIKKLEEVAFKYGVVVHKIDRYYPSSKTCTCGYVNKELKLTDREWTCPHCGAVHDRDLLAANNILRRGIYELESNGKTKKQSADGQLCYSPTITRITA